MKKLFLLFAVVFCTSVCANAQLKVAGNSGTGNGGVTWDFGDGINVLDNSGYSVNILKAGQTYTIRFGDGWDTYENGVLVPKEKPIYWILSIGATNNSYFYGSITQFTFTAPWSSQAYTISIYTVTDKQCSYTKNYTVQP